MDSAQKDQASALAQSLDCFTDEDLQRLAGVKASTTEAWRKRGTGPAYTRLGRQFFYPREKVREFLDSRLRQTRLDVKGLL